MKRLIAGALFAGVAVLQLPIPKAFAEEVKDLKTERYLEAKKEDLNADVYVLGPGDLLGLKIYNADEFSSELEIMIDGRAATPLLGNLRLQGMTLEEADGYISMLLSKQIISPEIQLRIIRPRPIRVAVIGEVERPGLYSLTTNEKTMIQSGDLTEYLPETKITGFPTMVDAIQKAGGITQQADLRRVKIQRLLPGRQKRYKAAMVNLLDLVLDGDQTQNPLLFDGDIIRIETAEETPEEAIELAAVNLSPKVIEVNVIGEVKRPGKLQVMANTPLVQAILAAGGLADWRANTGNIELVRINRNGTATLKRFKFDMESGASNSKNPPLRQGDTVHVQRSLYAKGSDAIGAVADPITGLVTVLNLFELLNRSD